MMAVVSRVVNNDIHTGVIRKGLDIRVYVRDDVVNIKKKSNGPRMDPWGTPAETLHELEEVFA